MRIPTRELNTPEDVRELFEDLSAGGQDITGTTLPGEMVLLSDGTRVMFRPAARSTDDAVVEVHAPDGHRIKVHVPRR